MNSAQPGNNDYCLPATCRLCEYQCYLAGNNDLHSRAVDSAWWINAACQATIVNISPSGAQGISTNIALPNLYIFDQSLENFILK